MHHPTAMIAHTTAFVTPILDHWLEREIAQWVHHEGSIQRPIAHMFTLVNDTESGTRWNVFI